MLPSLLVGTGLLVVCVAFSAVATALSVRLLAVLSRRGLTSTFWEDVAIVILITLIGAAVNLVLVALWAVVLIGCGEFADFDTAFHHSAGNYTTLGYGGTLMSPRWRLLAPMEAATGILCLGLSVALIFAVMSRLFQHRIPLDQDGKGKGQ
jgi:hypothetical protein